MKNIYLDLYSSYIPFLIQTTKSDGTKYDVSSSSLIIYEEDGGDSNFSSTQITGSPFSLNKVNSKTGYYGTLIDKSLFTVGKFYLALWELTIDGTDTAGQELYFVCNSTSFQSGSGGAYKKIYTVTDGSGNVIEGATIRATSDEAGTDTIAYGASDSDSNGEIIIYLPLGTVYIWTYHSDYTFDNPDEELVEA